MLTRRRALGAFATVIIGWLWAGATMRLWPWKNDTRTSDLESTTNDHYVALGRAYLHLYPEEASPSRLARLIPADPVLRTIQVRADFAAEKVVILDGWILSQTECRYCALHALTQAGRG